MRKLFYCSFIFFSFLLFPLKVTSQSKLVDSLKQELSKCTSVEDSVYYLCRITWRMSDTYAGEKLHYGKLALATSKRIDDKTKISEAYDAMALGYRANGDIKKTKYYMKKSLEVAEEYNLPDRIGFSAYHLAKIALNENKPDSVDIYVKKSRMGFKKTDRYDMMMKNTGLLQKKPNVSMKQYIDTMIVDLENFIEVATDPNILLSLYLQLTFLYDKLENKKQSLHYVQLAMDIAEELEKTMALVESYYIIANYFKYNQKNYEVALVYYNKIYEIYKSDTKENGIASIYNEIGSIYKLQGNDSMALDYYNKSLDIATKLGHRHTIANAYKNIGEINYSAKNYNEALGYYLKCYETGCDKCPQISFHTALINIGNVYMHSKDYHNALIYFQKALFLADTSNANYERAVSYTNLANYYEVRNNRQMSIINYHKSLDYAQIANSLQLQAEITGQLSRLYFEQNDFNKAYSNLVVSKMLSDSLETISKADNLASLETRFELRNLQMQKELDKATSEKEISRQKLLRNFFIAGLILFGLSGFFIYLGYRRKKKDNVVLNEQKLAIQQMSKRLHEADQAKLQFFTNVSHELRTPLTLILGMTEKLKSTVKDHQVIHIIRKHSLKLLQLINHLLDLRKLDTSMMTLSIHQGNLYEFLKGIISSFEDFACQKGITMELIHDGNNIVGYFDHDKLEKIFSNLISNAVKYNSKNGHVQVSVAKENNGYARIDIKDNGRGIEEREIKNIFNRFYRESDNGLQGSGIGLALVKELVELHKGEINVHSIKNAGSLFIVRIPVEKQYYSKEVFAQMEIEKPSYNYVDALDLDVDINTKQLPDQTVTSRKTMLIVEDNVDLRKYIADIFKDEFQIMEAQNGEDGYNLSFKFVPDIIISDIMMPKLTGIQLVDKLKGNVATSHIPVILLTAKSDNETRLTGFEKGADDYISKPFDSSLLRSRVENLIRLRKQLVDKFSKQFHLQPREITIENADHKFLKKAIGIIELNINNPELNVDLLAVELGVSRTQLYRKLQALTDYSANQFIRIIRLKRAAQILRKGQNNIAEVMDATGFSNYSYFNNCFKEYFGELPKDYALSYVKERAL